MQKNPQHEDIRSKQNKYSIRKMTAGAASVIVGSLLLFANPANAQEVNISEDEALDIASDAAGVDSIGYLDDFELDSDDGVYYYEFEFTTDGVEYDFEIDAATGEVLDLDIDGTDVQVNGNDSTGVQDDGVNGTDAQDDGFDDNGYDEVESADGQDVKKDHGKKVKADTLGHYEAYVHGTFGKDDFAVKGDTAPHGYVKVMLPHGEVHETKADKHGNFKLDLPELKAWDEVSVYFADKHGNDANLDVTVKPYDEKHKDKDDDKKDDKDYYGKKAENGNKGSHGYKDDQKVTTDKLGHYDAYVKGTFGTDDFAVKGDTVPHGYVKVMLPHGEVHETKADKHGNFKLDLPELKAWDEVSVYFADKHGNDANLDVTVKPYDEKHKDKDDDKKGDKDYYGKKADSSHK